MSPVIAACQYLVLLCYSLSETKLKCSNKEPQILADNNQLSHLSRMKPPGSLRVISSSHWDSVWAATVVTFSQPRCCCHYRLNEVPLCLRHIRPSLSVSLCNPFNPFGSYLNRPGQTANTGIPDKERQRHREVLLDLQREEEKVTVVAFMCTLWKAIPFPHLHLYEFISSWSYCGRRSCFHHRKTPFDPCESLVFVPLIWGSVTAQSTMDLWGTAQNSSPFYNWALPTSNRRGEHKEKNKYTRFVCEMTKIVNEGWVICGNFPTGHHQPNNRRLLIYSPSLPHRVSWGFIFVT